MNHAGNAVTVGTIAMVSPAASHQPTEVFAAPIVEDEQHHCALRGSGGGKAPDCGGWVTGPDTPCRVQCHRCADASVFR